MTLSIVVIVVVIVVMTIINVADAGLHGVGMSGQCG